MSTVRSNKNPVPLNSSIKIQGLIKELSFD